MTTKIFNLTSTFKSDVSDDGEIKIRGMASTADFDRAGDSISPEAWAKGGLDNFTNNPIILFNHDYNRPIGRATKVTSVDGGLHLEARISKAAKDVAELVKDGVLGAFSVGFRVKDADYVEETDGLLIKDAELFEVSVVSVPCNQAATFSLAKSFDSVSEYEEFKKTFTNRVDLAGQSLAKDEDNTSSVASDAPDGANLAQKEIQMDNESNIDLEAFAKRVAEETAAKVAMKQAEQKVAEEKAAQEQAEKESAEAEARSQQEEEVKQAIVVGVESNAARLVEDVRKEFENEKADMEDVISKYKTDLEEKMEEIEAMRNSKRDFSGRKANLKEYSSDLLGAHILGKITRKGYDTDYAKELFEKAGVTYDATSSAGIDVMVSSAFEEEVRQAQKVAPLFRELAVSSGATVLPIAPDTEPANWSTAGAETAANNLEEAGASDNNYNVNRITMLAYRLISSTFISNDTDEKVVVTLLPIIQSALARAHAIAIDKAILVGGGWTTGLVGASGTDDTNGYATASATTALDASGAGEVTPATLLGLRKEMGKYGLDPSRVAFIVPTDGYYELIDASGFTDVQEVGSDLATKLVGVVGSVYGSPVVATDQLAQNLSASGAATTTAALAVNVDNYVVPRLAGVSIETDYIIKEQRSVIVASQSLGFNELVANSGSNVPSVRYPYS